jgi:hypothetical protein
MRDKDFITYITASISLCLVLAWYFGGNNKPQDTTQHETFRVRTVKVQSGMNVWVSGPGRITDDNVMELVAHVSGVITYLADPGVELDPGDPIIVITPSDGRSLEASRLNMESKVRECENQEKAQRAIALEMSDAGRGCTVDEYVARAASVVRARVEAAKALSEYEACKQVLCISARCKGYFALPRASGGTTSIGSYVSQGTHLGKFVKKSSDLVIEMTLAQKDCANVKNGQPVIFTLDTPSGPLMVDGQVAGVDNTSDLAISGAKVRVFCPALSDTELKYCSPGVDGNGAILVQKLDCFLVEEAAVMEGWLLIKVNPANQSRGFAELVPIEIVARAYGYVGFVLKYPAAYQLKPNDLVSLDHLLTGWNDINTKIPVTIIEASENTCYSAHNVQILSDSAQNPSKAVS